MLNEYLQIKKTLTNSRQKSFGKDIKFKFLLIIPFSRRFEN
jgi:hypothetical protein